MNRILFEAHELQRGEARLDDRRARHVREVLRAAVGDRLRAGVLGGALGEATVLALEGRSVRLAVSLTGETPPTPGVHLVLAVPRPKVLGRVLQTVGALGVFRLDLVNAWRVEKSYFQSPRLAPAAASR